MENDGGNYRQPVYHDTLAWFEIFPSKENKILMAHMHAKS